MNLSNERFAEISAKLPDASAIQSRLLLPVDLIVARAGPQSKIDIAIVCLRDASETFWEVGYALGQAYSHLVWHREERPDAPNEQAAVLLGKYYADDVALRLYAAGEDVANFIVAFLNIQEGELKPYKEDIRITSRQAIVGRYMTAEKADHKITAAIQSLLRESNWRKTMKYRNTWVHDQPPPVRGLGIVYVRKGRWLQTEVANSISIGGGDEPPDTVDSLIEIVASASHAFSKLLFELSEILFEEIGRLGVKIDHAAGRTSTQL